MPSRVEPKDMKTHPPTSTSDETKPFYSNAKGSNGRHSKCGACITDNALPNEANQMGQTLS